MTDVSIVAAILAGVVSFLSPCVLPLVPGYLAFVSGTGAPAADQPAASRLRHVSARSGAFVLGFSTIFVLLGASATHVGRFLVTRAPIFEKVAGLVVILFGLHLLGLLKIPILNREKRIQSSVAPRSLAGSYGVGMAFGFGWTPCIGPILGAVLMVASVQETVWQGVGLLTAYSLGLSVPFLFCGARRRIPHGLPRAVPPLLSCRGDCERRVAYHHRRPDLLGQAHLAQRAARVSAALRSVERRRAMSITTSAPATNRRGHDSPVRANREEGFARAMEDYVLNAGAELSTAGGNRR